MSLTWLASEPISKKSKQTASNHLLPSNCFWVTAKVICLKRNYLSLLLIWLHFYYFHLSQDFFHRTWGLSQPWNLSFCLLSFGASVFSSALIETLNVKKNPCSKEVSQFHQCSPLHHQDCYFAWIWDSYHDKANFWDCEISSMQERNHSRLWGLVKNCSD